MLIDITRTMGIDTLVYPGDTPHKLSKVDDMAAGGSHNLSRMECSPHWGTHLDAPSHFIEDGFTIDELPLERFHLRAHVIDTLDATAVRPDHLEGWGIEPGDAVLFRTTNTFLPREEPSPVFVGLTIEATHKLVEMEVSLVGIDYLTVEQTMDNPDSPVHMILLGAGMLILEEANLTQVAEGTFELTCFPLKLYNTEASPVRAVLEPIE